VGGRKVLKPHRQKFELYQAHDKVQISEPMGFKYWSDCEQLQSGLKKHFRHFTHHAHTPICISACYLHHT